MDTKTMIELADLIFKIIAGLFAAFWAVYLLRLIHRPLVQAGLLKSKTEQARNLLGGLAITLQATAHRKPGRADFVIIAIAKITNRSESEVFRIEWTEGPLHVWTTKFDDKGSPIYENVGGPFFVRKTSDPDSPAGPLRIRPGATESLSFAVGVSTPGIYFLTFRIPIDHKYLVQVEELSMLDAAAWTCNAHVVVGDIPEPVSRVALK
jgi:hypothetical protein